MSYLAREDGEHFVIPSYRDVLSKRKSQLKGDILELSARYGEYMTFQRRGLAQFEVAFSSEGGYLFGECVWQYFKRPLDLIYCEVIPDTAEAYFVIVKNGSVYLDGRFPFENIAEEVLVFTTQENQFDIYVYGDGPISEQPEEGKISFEATSVKSFNRLPEPLFEHLPLVKTYQLLPVDVVLRQQGIGVFPVKFIIAVAVILGLIWMGFSYRSVSKKTAAPVAVKTRTVVPKNPFVGYNTALMSAPPDAEIEMLVLTIDLLMTMPGWIPTEMNYVDGQLTVHVKSQGINVEFLYNWAEHNYASIDITPGGFSLKMTLPALPGRGIPSQIYPLDRVIMNLIDRMAVFMPGNAVKVGAYKIGPAYKESDLRIELQEISPGLLFMVGEQFKDLPLTLTSLTLKINHGLTGTILLRALGN